MKNDFQGLATMNNKFYSLRQSPNRSAAWDLLSQFFILIHFSILLTRICVARGPYECSKSRPPHFDANVIIYLKE